MGRAPKEDWHPADVAAALKKTPEKWSLRQLSLEFGYYQNAASYTLRHPWPAVEAIIASALQISPAEIWPTRYDAKGHPSRKLRPNYPITQRRGGNVRAARIA